MLSQIVQQLNRGAPSACHGVGASKIGGECRSASGNLDRFLELCDRFTEQLLLKARRRQQISWKDAHNLSNRLTRDFIPDADFSLFSGIIREHKRSLELKTL